MTMSLSEDIKTMTELEKHPEKIVKQIHETGRPVVILKDGKADLVILDVASYEHQLRVKNLAELLAEGEADIKARRTRPIEEFFEEIGVAKKKVSGRNHKNS
jgi:PHD/YefM family antitoxin component YafN of YafNO toxin-antitoxin module